MMKYIEEMYQDKFAITASSLYQKLQDDGNDIEYSTLKTLIKLYIPLPINTIVNTIQTIKVNTARKTIYFIMQSGAYQSKTPNVNPGVFITEIIEKLDAINSITSSTGTDFDDILDQIISQTESVFAGKQTTYYKTGIKEIDKKFPIVNDNIILVGGPAKHGKSRFIMFLIKKLFENYPDTFALKWYSFEENADEVVRKFIAYDTLLSDEEITGRKRKLTADDTSRIVKSAKSFKKLNIKVEDNPRSIQQIQAEFGIFVKKNKGVPILVIDNLLLITNDEYNRDDIIMNTINHIKQRTGALIFLVHHFNDDQQDKSRESEAFRPTLKDLKGREAYRRVPKVILLINYPYKYPKINNKYKNKKDILEHMFIVDVAAIRYMGEQNVEGSGTEKNLIYFYCDLGVNHFYPLSSLWKDNPELKLLNK